MVSGFLLAVFHGGFHGGLVVVVWILVLTIAGPQGMVSLSQPRGTFS